MARTIVETFEGPQAYLDAATLAAKTPGAVVEHEGVLFSVVHDPANAPATAVPNVAGNSVAAAIAAAKARKA